MRLQLDTAQYQADVDAGIAEQVYSGMSVVLRRKPKENNFKAVLQTIKELMTSSTVVPDWLHDIFLGFLLSFFIIISFILTLLSRVW